MRNIGWVLVPAVIFGWAAGAAAQVRLDRADPSITEQALPKPRPQAEQPQTTVAPTAPAASVVPPEAPRIARRIVVAGAEGFPADAFELATAPYVGRNLASADLVALAGAVSNVARRAGYPFATASIPPQGMADGVLRVTLDEGRITAVRVIGAVNPLADRMLTQALVTGSPVRKAQLERAILAVGDLPGVTVTESKFSSQDGFGILIVTIAEDRATAYAQLDNRGSSEVGPIRGTLLAAVRGLAQDGDELGLLVAATPFQPSEFALARLRYSAPVDLRGSTLSASGSYGRANPGASLRPLDVVGHSMDAAVAYSRPLIRSRARSLWGSLELRALKSDQSLLGTMLRDDRLTTLTGSVNGTASAGAGVLRGEIGIVAGLPLPNVTHEGDRLTSRPDGDARFVLGVYSVDWTYRFNRRFGLVLASAGQVASRPLLATMEIGAGGPAFGRGYDYAERTGDDGVLGSAELRADMGGVIRGVIDRLQLYGFVDGGYVGNLRDGIGGGGLVSGGIGARLGTGKLDGMIEIAQPFNADRFDTGKRDPRISFRVSRSF